MTHLYTCRSAGDQYRITKLDRNLDVESSYLCSAEECQCPGFERRGRCRHLEMLPRFIHRGHIGDGWALDFDRLDWEKITDEGSELPTEAGPQRDFLTELAAIPGVTVISLDDPEKLYNTIAEAVGESPLKPFVRRF